MCRRQIINAGITRVIIRTGDEDFRTVEVSDWISHDDSLFWAE